VTRLLDGETAHRADMPPLRHSGFSFALYTLRKFSVAHQFQSHSLGHQGEGN